jgi:glutamate--cysteine ligase
LIACRFRPSSARPQTSAGRFERFPDGARHHRFPADRAADELVEHIAAGCKPREQWRIGTEHEKFPFYVDGNSPVPYGGDRGIKALLEGMQKTLGWDPIVDAGHIIGLVEPTGQGAISLEPGGQFELSGAPLETIHQTCREGNAHLAQLRQIAEPLGIRFLGLGGSPKWTLAETPRMPKSRYDIMTAYMPKVGTQGLDMMYRTCTIQVNLDFESEADMRRKMQVSMKLQPLSTALFANSPFTEGRPNGLQSWRGEIWRDTDNQRAGLLPFVFSPDFGFADYVEWALDVPMYFLIREGRYFDCTHVTFRQFMAARLKDTFPTACRPWATGPTICRRCSRGPAEAVPGNARRRWRSVAAHLRAAGLLGRAAL